MRPARRWRTAAFEILAVSKALEAAAREFARTKPSR